MRADPDRTTSMTMSTVLDAMELGESSYPRSTTPAKYRHEKERDSSDGESESSDDSDDLITDVDWVQCAGQWAPLLVR